MVNMIFRIVYATSCSLFHAQERENAGSFEGMMCKPSCILTSSTTDLKHIAIQERNTLDQS